ncbi:MAG: ATP phosphoribosyltransferase [Thermoleophilaceae bacterium]|nr:ATP phosphoribosyltransferase [Thermoleophilaceae bacterium]
MTTQSNRDRLTVAVPRGALLGDSLALLEAAGFDVLEVRENERKLFFDRQGIITMRPSDVPTYVEHGVADIGIVGKDVLMEQFERDVYELLDLGFGLCRMVVAVPKDNIGALDNTSTTHRVATSYTAMAERHFAATGRQIEVIEIRGSVELSAISGLADGIVDLTATGTTLRENGLVETEEIAVCTARLIANPASYRLKVDQIDSLVATLRQLVAAQAG